MKAEQACRFVWCELMTTDARGAEKFYRKVVGWDAEDAGISGMDYTIFTANGRRVAGLMALPEEACAAGAGPGWTGYIAAGDVDAAAKQLAAAGGAVHRPPADIPGVGRFAIAADPQGASFALFSPLGEAAPEPAPGTQGAVGWSELHASDWRAAFRFYAEQFGWTRSLSHDMGAMGVYQIFAIDGADAGGMMNGGAAFPDPAWVYYFNVEGIDAASERIAAGGGEIRFGPQEVPGGSWIIQAQDPQGAIFALVSLLR